MPADSQERDARSATAVWVFAVVAIAVFLGLGFTYSGDASHTLRSVLMVAVALLALIARMVLGEQAQLPLWPGSRRWSGGIVIWFAVIPLGVLTAIWWSNAAYDQTSLADERRRIQEEERLSKRKRKHAAYVRERDAFLQAASAHVESMHDHIEGNDYEAANRILDRFLAYDALEAHPELEELRRKIQTALVLEEIESMPPDDYPRRARAYEYLWELHPTNDEYQELRDQYLDQYRAIENQSTQAGS